MIIPKDRASRLSTGATAPAAFFCFLSLVLFLSLGQLTAQVIPVSVVKVSNAGTLSFDKKDSLVIMLPTGTVLNWVSYKKLARNRSFAEQEDEERAHDRVLRQKFPYSRDQFDSFGRLKPGEQPKAARSIFFNIPDNNITRVNDSTYKVFFNRHEGYYRKVAREKETYYRNLKRRHIRRYYIEKDSDFLEPASRYLLILGTSSSDNPKIFDQYDDEIRKRVNGLPKTKDMIKDLDQLQRQRLYGKSFVPPFTSYEDIYNTVLKSVYDDIDTLKNKKTTENAALAGQMETAFIRNGLLITLQNALNDEQQKDFHQSGISRDSLSMLFTLLSNLYYGSKTFYENICSGTQALQVQVSTGSDDANVNLPLSISSLNRLVVFVDKFGVDNSANVNISRGIQSIHDQLVAWGNGLNNTIKENKGIQSDKQKIAQTIGNTEKFSGVTMNDASSFAQDIVVRGKLSIAPDFGVISYGFLEGSHNRRFTGVTPYLGAQVNIRPYDQSVPFGSLPRSRKGLLNPIRFSAMVGITFVSVKETGKRDNFFGGTNLLLGVGYRLSTEVRLVAGAMLFKKYDENYVSSQESTAATAYAGLSIDLNLKDLFSNVLGVFTGK